MSSIVQHSHQIENMIKTEVLPHKILGVEFAPFFIPIARRLQVRKYITSPYKSLWVNVFLFNFVCLNFSTIQ